METSRPLTALHLRFAQFLKLTLGVLVMLPAVSGAAAVEYESRILDVNLPPTDINDSGWVVGRNSSNGSAVLRAGRSRTLVSSGSANAVNNAGVVVGERTDSTGRHAFRTTPAQSDVIEDLGLLPGGTYSVATAINATGDAVGYANVMASGVLVEQVVAFPAGQQEPKSLGHLPSYGGVAASASGINDGGDIVGSFRKADGKYRPFRYLAGSDIKPLPGFDDVVEARAIAINNSGRIIGNLTYADGRQRGFVFENGARTDIEAPAPDAGKHTWAYGLNDAGHVVGAYNCGATTCPFVLVPEGVVNLLGMMPGRSSGYAQAINNNGEIAIYADGYSWVLSPRRPRPVVQYSGLPLLRAPIAGDGFGSALALHGNVAVIGAPGENGGTGAVYVYRYGDVAWVEELRLTPDSPIRGGRFGSSIAFDGYTIVVGAPSAEAAYVFKRPGSGWEQTAMLSTGSTKWSQFGAAVAVKDARIVVGAPYAQEKTAGIYSGAVYVFDWNGTQWDRTKLAPADLPANANMLLGASVQLDGDSILAGAPQCLSSFSCGFGEVYIFQRQTSDWSEQKLTQPNDYYGKVGFGAQIAVQNDVLAVRASYYSLVYLYRRGTAAEGVPWVEQDWVTSLGPVAVDGDRLAVTEYTGKYLPRLLKREGRIWVDALDMTPMDTSITALALQGSTLLVGSATGAGVATPYSICAAAPCTDLPPVDLELRIESPATALTSELMTHTLVVKNLNSTATAGLVSTESTFTDSNSITPSWIQVPDACQVSSSRMKVICSVNGLAALQEVRFEMQIAAPVVAGGTFTHKASALHARPDPVPENNTATATTTIMSSVDPRIEIYSPYDGQNVKRRPNEAIDLIYEIQNFTVASGGDFFTVSVDGATPVPYDKQQSISLDVLTQGSHQITISLMVKNTTRPLLTKTVEFTVEVTTPSVVIAYPLAGETIICHRGELIAPRVKINYWKLGESGQNLLLQIDGGPLGDVIANENGFSGINLCDLGLDATHDFTAVLRDSTGSTRATSDPVRFEVRKVLPKIEITQPIDGGVDYARGGFTLIYEFVPGYDDAELSMTLNGIALSGPLPTTPGTNAAALPQEQLRDGANELIVTATTEGRELQIAVVRFTTQVAASPPQSKGGAADLWALLFLVLRAWAFRKKNYFSKRRVRGVE